MAAKRTSYIAGRLSLTRNALCHSDSVDGSRALLACAGVSMDDLLERERKAYKLLNRHDNELKV